MMRFHLPFLKNFTWDLQFLLASLFVLAVGMVGIGWWVGLQIENGVIHQTGTYTALYVTSLVEPNLQELSQKPEISAEHKKALDRLFLGRGPNVTLVRIWNRRGEIVYSNDSRVAPETNAEETKLTRVLSGWMSSELGNLDESEKGKVGDPRRRILTTYSPVRVTGTNTVVAAVEVHQTAGPLDGEIASAQTKSWLIVVFSALVMYLLLAGFVRRAEKTLKRQQNELRDQMVQMRALHERVRRAAHRTATVNERFLRRVSAELHDGPAQELAFVLLRLKQLIPSESEYSVVQSSLQLALQEIRDISAGMGLPGLESLSLPESIQRAVRAHERRTKTEVSLTLNGLPETAALSVKIAAYRILQEALTNSFKHAEAREQVVQADYQRGELAILVSDAGKGFDRTLVEWEEHLGLVGMRERAESLGGVFQIESRIGQGTRIQVHLPLDAA